MHEYLKREIRSDPRSQKRERIGLLREGLRAMGLLNICDAEMERMRKVVSGTGDAVTHASAAAQAAHDYGRRQT